MEETDTAKQWFVTHEGKQFGPVSIEDLKFEVKRGELNPRLDMVWKEGMGDWMPAGEVPGLFEKNVEAEVAETAKETTGNFTPYTPGETEEERERIKGNWPGAGRGSYFFMNLIFPLLFSAGAGAATPLIASKMDPAIFGIVAIVLYLVPLLLSVVYTLMRFRNLGMSRWWLIGQLVPLLNIWLTYRLFACPPGYAQNKKLDGLGWFLAVIYWLFALIMALAVASYIFMITMGPEKLRELLPQKEAEGFIEFMEEASGQGDHDSGSLTEPEEDDTE